MKEMAATYRTFLTGTPTVKIPHHYFIIILLTIPPDLEAHRSFLIIAENDGNQARLKRRLSRFGVDVEYHAELNHEAVEALSRLATKMRIAHYTTMKANFNRFPEISLIYDLDGIAGTENHRRNRRALRPLHLQNRNVHEYYGQCKSANTNHVRF